MTNQEKTAFIDSPRLETGHALKGPAASLRIPKSPYGYRRAAIARKDKYGDLRRKIVEISEEADRTRGYRYVAHGLRGLEEPIVVSEKVVHRIMSEENCVVIHDKKAKHCSSCKGEISDVFGNGFLDILAARFRQSGKRTADVSDFCLPEHQGLVHPLARAVELDESSMVDHPVDHRGGKLVVAQDRSPFAELDVGGEHHASLLVAC